jgi:predicted RNA binding protein YcfA (HicA-like mRNA interferase family)
MPRKVGEIIKLIEADGWVWTEQRGVTGCMRIRSSLGVVVIPGKLSQDLPLGTERSILKQAGLR